MCSQISPIEENMYNLREKSSNMDPDYNSLHVTNNEIQTIPWASTFERLFSHKIHNFCVVKDLSAHDMVM